MNAEGREPGASPLSSIATTPPTRALARRAPRPASAIGRSLEPWFPGVAFDRAAAERLEAAYARGVVVHVFRSRRLVDPLYLLWLLERLGLPSPSWLHDHPASRRRGDTLALKEAVLDGEPTLLFLRRPRGLLDRSTTYPEGWIEALAEAQRLIDKPILLVPESLLWRRRAGGLRRTIVDVVFGDRDAPGRLRELFGFLANRSDARFHVGQPIDLSALLPTETSDQRLARKVRASMLHHLAREETLRTGPPQRPHARTRQLVLAEPAVEAAVARAKEGPGAAGRRANHIFDRLAADVRFDWVRVFDASLDAIFRRIYDGITVDGAGMDRVKEAARRGAVVLMPSHKSHADYLILSQVFLKHGLMVPFIAAGDNLAIWPIGKIFRRSGAFFIRRSFRGDALYGEICAAYVRRLLKDGATLEFFVEGGRSRTGKLLEPKLGMLSMCVDAVLDGAVRDLTFVPVSISYERIIEAGSYRAELEGKEKRKEDLGALLSTSKVLRSRYGRVYVDFEEPISLRAFAAARGIEIGPGEATQKTLTSQLAARVIAGIGAVTRVTPTGLAASGLLASTERGKDEAELHRRLGRLIELLEAENARFGSSLLPSTRREAIRAAIERLAEDRIARTLTAPTGETIFQVEDAARPALDYYKNNILHFFAAYADVALALLRLEAGEEAAVLAGAKEAFELLATELPHRASRAHELALATLAKLGYVERGEAVTITEIGRSLLRDLAGLVAPFLEAQRFVLESVGLLEAAPLPEKKLVGELMRLGKKQALVGKIRRFEAVTQPTLAQATRALLRLGGLARVEDGLAPGPGEVRTKLERELDGYLAKLA